MKVNRVKRILKEGGVVLGTMVFEFNSPGIGRLARDAGADFVVFDMEHTGWSMETVRMLMATSRPSDLVPVTRVPTLEYQFVARALDVGAMGIMVPQLETEEQARSLVRAAKYPPVGRRGVTFGTEPDEYRDEDVDAVVRSANEEGLLIVQIESARGVDQAQSIAAIDGIDVLWVGQFDLTTSMGIPGQFTHPEFARALELVLAACQRHDKAAGYSAGSVEELCTRRAQGFRCLSYSEDYTIYKETLRTALADARARLGDAELPAA